MKQVSSEIEIQDQDVADCISSILDTPVYISELPHGKRKLFHAITDSEYSETNIGFVCRFMASATIPHSKMKQNVFKRSTGRFVLEIVGSEFDGGIPYGVYPRLMLMWIVGEAVRTKNREINLGKSISDFMKKLGICVTGGSSGTLERFKAQLRRLFSCTISFVYEDKKSGRWERINMTLVDRASVCLNFEDEQSGFNSTIVLGEMFFDEIKRSPIPIDTRAVQALKDSSLALDIYFWLTYRFSHLIQETYIPFEALYVQFGSGYENTRQGRFNFKNKFLEQLNRVKAVYTQARIRMDSDNFILSPSQTHVPKKSSRVFDTHNGKSDKIIESP